MAQTGWLQLRQQKAGEDPVASGNPQLTWAAFRALLETTTDGILLLDQQGFLRHASRIARERLALDPARLGRVRLEDLVSSAVRLALETWRVSACAGADSLLVSPSEVALPGGQIVRLTARGPLAGLVSAGPLWQIGVEDASAESAREEASLRAEAELSAVLEAVDSGILLLDDRGRIRYANARLGDWLGLESRRLASLGTLDDILNALAASLRDPQQVLPVEIVELYDGGGAVPAPSRPAGTKSKSFAPTAASCCALPVPCWTPRVAASAGWKSSGTSPASG